LRILIFSWRDLEHPSAGGAEVFTHEVSYRWVRLGHEVTVFVARPRGLSEREEVDGVRYVRKGSRTSVYREARKFYRAQPPASFDLVIDQINTRPFFCQSFVRDAAVVGLIFQVAREVWMSEVAFPLALIGRYVLEPIWLRRYRNVSMVTISESSRRAAAAISK